MVTQENSFVKYEFNNFKLIVTIKKPYPNNDEEWKHTLLLMKCFYEAAEKGDYKYSILFDIRKLGLINVSYFWDCSRIFTENKKSTEKHIIKTGIITNNNIIKNSLNLFFKLCPPTRPMQFLSENQEIESFLMETVVI